MPSLPSSSRNYGRPGNRRLRHAFSYRGCLSRALALHCNRHLLTVATMLLASAIALQAAERASAEVKDTPSVPGQPDAASPLKETVPAETADCARMPTETQKSDCLRQHPY